MMNVSKISGVLCIDLDGTLLHPEPEAIPVLGRSGYRYLSAMSAELLEMIGKEIPMVIATGRNARSVRRMTDQLPNVRFFGFVMENGLVARKELHSKSPVSSRWDELADFFPDWERLGGYENCLGMIPPRSAENPEEHIGQILSLQKQQAFIYRENHKIFIYPFMPGKLSGCRTLGVKPFIAVGDERNDADMIDAADSAATLSTAHDTIKDIVFRKHGYCSPLSSHAAAEDMLRWVIREVRRYGTHP